MHRCQSRCGEPRSICPAATFDFHLDEKPPMVRFIRKRWVLLTYGVGSSALTQSI